jgi:hypothetical protein
MWMTATMGPNGFGNEFVKIAKLLVCRRMLCLPILPVYWRSAYRAALPGGLCRASRCGRLLHLAWQRGSGCRRLAFGPAEHRATEQIPVEKALARFLEERRIDRNSRTIVELVDIVPGIETVEAHGRFLYDTLLAVPANARWLAERRPVLDGRKRLIGVHIRRGDFRSERPLGVAWPENGWNIRIPLEWYEQACAQLAAAFPGQLQFIVATDGADADVDRFCRRHGAVLLKPRSGRSCPDVADMLILASCVALVSSVSWFSGWAAILNPKPWLWYSCAHGAPPWGAATAFPFAGQGRLPDAFLAAVARAVPGRGAETSP